MSPTKILTPLLLLFVIVLPLSAKADDEKPDIKPAYYELKPSLVVNLPSGARYIRCDVQLMTLDESLLPGIELHAPAVRDALLMLLTDQDGARLKTAEGKEALRQEAIAMSRKLMEELTGEGSIDELFFTAFFVQ